MLASDVNNPEFANPQNPDSLLNVQFYVKAAQNNWKTQQEGRPIFDDVVMIRIVPPGDGLNIVDTPAQDHHKQRFPRHWEHFQKMHSNLASGTPLEQWPLLGPSQVAQLKAMSFLSVEQIAGAPDDKLGRIGMAGGMSPFTLREKAKRYLDVAQESSAYDHAKEEAEKLREEMRAKEEKHAQEIADLREQMQQFMAQKRKPGRPRKQAEPEATV